MSAPGKGDDVLKRMASRIVELSNDGYVTMIDRKWFLTAKGWAVLYACAERPMPKPKRKEKA